MISAIARKGRQVAADPVLRQWIVRRLCGLEPGEPDFVAGSPPYLEADELAISRRQEGAAPLPHVSHDAPAGEADIPLAGRTVRLSAQAPAALFDRTGDDLETALSAHRFAWVPVAGDTVSPAWVAAIWSAWVDRYAENRSGWPWHAYTATERAINLIDFARMHGLPEDARATEALLLSHADAIAGSLEYFGDHYTSNHLSNNGRGLLRIGAALGRNDIAALGLKIMVREADRIFGASGLLREGSSHYHMLLTRNYLDGWMEADTAGLDGADALRDVAARALGAVPVLHLPGGLPLIGDISPDCPPAYLDGLSGAIGAGWPEAAGRDVAALDRLRKELPTVSRDAAAADGWHQFGSDGWQALAYVPPDGWPPMPGHGHQDLGSFELHWNDIRVLVDPGRGSYRDAPADRRFTAADAHNGITVDGCDPAPVNRPYYRDAFRRRIVARPPEAGPEASGYAISHWGFGRLRGPAAARRTWRFSPDRVEIADRMEGRGTHRIVRHFCTPHPVRTDGTSAIIKTPGGRFRLSAEGRAETDATTCWTAYGEGRDGTAIRFEQRASLPFEGHCRLERV